VAGAVPLIAGAHLLEVGLRWPPEAFIQRKLSGLAAAGMRVTVGSTTCADAHAPALDGVRVVHMPSWRERPSRQLAAVCLQTLRPGRSPLRAFSAAAGPHRPPHAVDFKSKLTLVRALSSLVHMRPDLVHFEWESAAVQFLPVGELLGCPIVMSCRGGDIDIYPHLGSERWATGVPRAFEAAAAVHCVSENTKRAAVAQGLDPAKASVITPAVDPSFFVPPARPRERGAEMRLVSLGWLRWRKGWEYGLETLGRLVANGVPARLDIVGDDPGPDHGEPSERERILCAAEDSGVRDRVRVLGPLPPAGVRDLLQRSDALLHASLAEGIPNVVLESMSCELPVVTTDAGGVREAVSDGVEGFVVSRRDCDGLARGLEALWRDPSLAARMGAAGRARVEQSFTLAEQERRWAELYSRVLESAS
jgi:colanic acid/amylovoran biosynthesis glycosyltransferase